MRRGIGEYSKSSTPFCLYSLSIIPFFRNLVEFPPYSLAIEFTSRPATVFHLPGTGWLAALPVDMMVYRKRTW
jgi:hypothetical protein